MNMTTTLNMTISMESKKANDPPKKPLSAYNLFFQYHRIKLLSESSGDNGGSSPGLEDVDPASDLLSAPKEVIRKHRKESIKKVLDENPFRIDNEKRVHSKTHGKMSFLDMSKHMGQKWKSSDEETRSIFRQLANEGKAKFNKSVCDSYKAACSRYNVVTPTTLPQKATPVEVAYPPMAPICNYSMNAPVAMTRKTLDEVVPAPSGASDYKELLNIGEMHEMLQGVEWAQPRADERFNSMPLLSFVSKKEEINDDEFHRMLRGLDWSRLES